MNSKVISKYLQYLRKSHGYTQADLAEQLSLSRQAVSKWENGAAIPDLEVLLRLSKLYGMTINEILEPDIKPQRITDFEQLSAIPEPKLKEILMQFDTKALATALMGASPEINALCERLFPHVDFDQIQSQLGRVRIETVEELQNQIVTMINLQAVCGEL